MSTLEAEVLRVPFLFFPVENQAEQQVTVANRLARHKAGVRMSIADTSPNNWPMLWLPISAPRSLIQRFRLMEHTWQRGGYWKTLKSKDLN